MKAKYIKMFASYGLRFDRDVSTSYCSTYIKDFEHCKLICNIVRDKPQHHKYLFNIICKDPLVRISCAQLGELVYIARHYNTLRMKILREEPDAMIQLL